eukprot:gnl/Trimastix_PCT/2805.p1 GENE.gnl/Trimastix_PCT/2805~~gnl/Trimastix_PCT/2805.p1  ORF type:complete len:422 (+),score=66.83 gnl/Trimastix_PCT/2805:76-1341(+)
MQRFPPVSAALSELKPFITRAAELDAHEPLMSYYCRTHALDLALQMRKEKRALDDQSTRFLIAIMDHLEAEKARLRPLDSDAMIYVRGFAEDVFLRADNEDRAGQATKTTAATFLAASTFFEILKQFGPLPEEIEKKQLYARVKARDIGRALAAGQTPYSGPPGGEPSTDDLMPSPTNNSPPLPTHTPPPTSTLPSTHPSTLPSTHTLPTSSAIPPPSMNFADMMKQANATPPPGSDPIPPPPPSFTAAVNMNLSGSGALGTSTPGYGQPAVPPTSGYTPSPYTSPAPSPYQQTGTATGTAGAAGGYANPAAAYGQQPSHANEPNSPRLPPAAAPTTKTTYGYPSTTHTQPSSTQPTPTPTHTAASDSALMSAQPAQGLSYEVLQQAKKHARYAVQAIEYEDIPTALKELRAAMARLTNTS